MSGDGWMKLKRRQKKESRANRVAGGHGLLKRVHLLERMVLANNSPKLQQELKEAIRAYETQRELDTLRKEQMKQLFLLKLRHCVEPPEIVSENNGNT